MDIKGIGEVIIKGNSKRILNNNANLNITNIQFTNSSDSSACLVNNGNLTLNNTLFYSNVNINGYDASVIRNNKKLIVVDSKFYENSFRYGNIYNNAGEVLITSSEFYNNDGRVVTTVCTGLAVYSEGGNCVVENSKFHNNKGNFSLIYFKSKDSLSNPVINNLTIKNSTFADNNLTRYGAVYSEKANTIIKDSLFENNHVEKTSTANGEGAAIYVQGEKVSVENSQFLNNKADNSGNDIYVYSGNLTIADSVLITSNGYSVEKSDSANVIANDNWWGQNTPNTPVSVDRWVIMTVTCNDTDIMSGDEILITVSFNKTNLSQGIADYDGNLADLNVEFVSSGNLLNTVKTTSDKRTNVTYTVGKNDKNISVSSSKAQEILKVHYVLDIIYVSPKGDDGNDGDLNTPVKTIAKAIELAEKGQIIILNGTYKTPDLGIISKDLNITGQGKVIIDADNSNRILYVFNDSVVTLKNLIMINGYTSSSADESGALIGSAGNLTIINCTFANAKSEKNAGAIYNAGNLKVYNSTFENNTADKCGGAIFSQTAGIGIITSLYVENSIFKNNTAGGNSKYAGGAVYVQAASSAVILNSTFKNNKATQYGGGAVEITVTGTATIDKSTFINNTAIGEDYKTQSDFGGGAVSFIGSYGDLSEVLTITNSLFIDNSVSDYGGGAIYTRYAKVNISNSVLINNNDVNNVSLYRRTTDVNTAQITANDNWWGSNDNPKSNINGGTLTRGVILTVGNESEIREGVDVNITVSLNTYTTGAENGTLTSPIGVERDVTIRTTSGEIKGTLVNGEFKTSYSVPSNLKIITAHVDDEDIVLYVVATKVNLTAKNITASKGESVDINITVLTEENEKVNTGSVEVYFGDDLITTIDV